MAWSKVSKRINKPLGWWFHKILCEFGWSIRNYTSKGWDIYYSNLNTLCNKYNINLYGNLIK